MLQLHMPRCVLRLRTPCRGARSPGHWTPGAHSTFVAEDGGKDALGVATPERVRVCVTQCARNQLDPHLPRPGRINLCKGGAPHAQAEARAGGSRGGEKTGQGEQAGTGRCSRVLP